MAARAKIFISYRREDAPADARGVSDRLGRSFGAANVFMDVDRLMAGQRFERELEKALTKCDVLIAVIGSRWMALLDEYAAEGRRDYVREEIAGALQRDMVIIPVLMGRESNIPALPTPQSLPENIRDLVAFQKCSVAHETFRRDVDDLASVLKEVLRHKYGPGRSWWAVPAIAVVTVLLAGTAYVYRTEILPFAKAAIEMISLDRTQKAEADARKRADADALALEAARQRVEAARKAAEEMRSLGLMYAYGQGGVHQDEVKGRALLEQAAAQGDAYAMFQFGVLNEEGRGGPKDIGKAQEWYQKALDAGYGPARNALKNPR